LSFPETSSKFEQTTVPLEEIHIYIRWSDHSISGSYTAGASTKEAERELQSNICNPSIALYKTEQYFGNGFIRNLDS